MKDNATALIELVNSILEDYERLHQESLGLIAELEELKAAARE